MNLFDIMICSLCGGHNVTWRGPMINLTHTECADCGGINCQEPEPMEETEDLHNDPDSDTGFDFGGEHGEG